MKEAELRKVSLKYQNINFQSVDAFLHKHCACIANAFYSYEETNRQEEVTNKIWDTCLHLSFLLHHLRTFNDSHAGEKKTSICTIFLERILA